MDIVGLLEEAVSRHASDIHITVESPPVLRIYGELTRLNGTPLTQRETEAALTGICPPDHLEEFRSTGQTDFSYSLPGVGRFRVSAFRQRGSVAMSVRVLSSRVPTLGELALPLVVAELAVREAGLVVVTGPAGSGKSSTLAAMIDLINEAETRHVITIEDPIEYLHRHKRSIVNQREVGSDTRSFAGGVRAALREDPDVIMIGEIRDLETISLALAAAETGHLVLGALYTNGAVQAVDRLIDVFPPHHQQQARVQLSMVLEGIIAQQLLPRIDRPGRVAACEVLVGTPAVRNLLREGKSHQLHSAMQTGSKHGMRTMEQSLRDLYDKHVISLEEYKVRTGSDPERDLM